MLAKSLRNRIKRSPRLYRWWQWISRTPMVRAFREAGVSTRELRKLASDARHVDLSYAGEASHLAMLLDKLGIRAGTVVDLGAGDGVNQSGTLFLFRNPAWRGIAVELDEKRYQRLAFAYAQFPQARPVRAKITPASVSDLLRDHGIEADFDVLNLDIDSYDLPVAEALLQSFRPRVITMEINEKIPPPVYFAVHYSDDHVWSGGHYYGCSLAAASQLLESHGYVLESLQFNNAFFVRSDSATDVVEPVSVHDAYVTGYLSRPDRHTLFPWNHDMEYLHQLAPAEVVEALTREFRQYEGGFSIHLA